MLSLLQTLIVHSQSIEKSILKIIDNYIELEFNGKYSKDSVMIKINIDNVEKEGYVVNLSLYPTYLGKIAELKYIYDYRGYTTILTFEGKIKNEIKKEFKFLNAQPKIIPQDDVENIVRIIEPRKKALFQINYDNELYILEASDNNFYEEVLKSKIKVSKNLNSHIKNK